MPFRIVVWAESFLVVPLGEETASGGLYFVNGEGIKEVATNRGNRGGVSVAREVVYRIRSPRSFVTFVLILLGLISIVYIRGFLSVASLQREIAKVDQEIIVLQLRNEQIREEITKLQSPEYLEGTARRDLGLIKPGETVYRIAEPVEGSW